ncbi:uncharacterized protein LOC117594903 [Esox lucius]|uniref:uncharacterized protein LOC117594903 n=1 Tax=Esox lucius TaxID=8010 RepID=UPI0014772A0C|nr:uncharacterized protein LOC117594903 [Esox lucius]
MVLFWNTDLQGQSVDPPDEYSVRLVNGTSSCSGKLEVFEEGVWTSQSGAGFCSGRLEVKSSQTWVSVCESDFDQQDAEVVCRELGCGAHVDLQGGLNGEGPVLMFPCEGDLLVQPDIYLTDSMGGVFRSHQGPDMFKGYSFTITCSTQPQYPGGSFLLTFIGSNRTQTQTQPAVNHSTVFLFPAADDSHQGNYRCVYNNYVFSHNFSSESQLLFLTITASPHPAFIIRHVIVLLILLTVIITSCLNYKSTRGQKRVNRVTSMDLHVSTNVIEMVSLDSRTDAGPGEETAVQETE